MGALNIGIGIGVGRGSKKGLPPDPFSLFTYDIDFVAGTAKGGTQPYGNNNNDGRFFRDPNNITAVFVPNAAGLLVLQANAGLRRTDAGHWQYPSYGTCRNLWARDLTNAAWVSGGGGLAAVKNVTGADGVGNAATRLTASGANATRLQNITLASSTVLLQMEIKRITGTGNVDLTVDGGATWTTVAVGANFAQVSISQAGVTNPSIGIRLATAGDVVGVDFVNLYSNPPNGLLVPNAYRIATTSATVLGSQSRPNAIDADAGPLANMAKGAWAFFWKGRSTRAAASGPFIMTSDGGFQCSVQPDGSAQFAFGAAVANSNAGGWRTGMGNVNKAAGFIAADGTVKFCLNGANVGVASGAALASNITHFDLGTNGSGANSIYGTNERIAYGPNLTFTNAQLQAMTT